MLFWSRSGKSLQGLAGIAVILEIVGATRLRMFGTWLRGRITIDSARRYIKKSLGLLFMFVLYLAVGMTVVLNIVNVGSLLLGYGRIDPPAELPAFILYPAIV